MIWNRATFCVVLTLALAGVGCSRVASLGVGAYTDVEDSPTTCCDGIDNDGDSLVDAAEPSCSQVVCRSSDAGVDGSSLPPAVCGNNVLEAFEECEDGDTVSGDGCDEACQLESSVCADKELHHMRIGTTGQGDTTASSNSTAGSCGGAFAGEDVWVVNLPRDARLRLSMAYDGTDNDFHAAMYVRDSCAEPSTESACGVHASEYAAGWLNVPSGERVALDAGNHFVYVDGLAGESGAYEIGVTAEWFAKEHEPCGYDPTVDAFVSCYSGFECVCPAGTDCPSDTLVGSTCEAFEPRCGNGIVESGEECDEPGNEFGTCTPDCRFLELDCSSLSEIPTIVPGAHTVGTTAGDSHFVSTLCGEGLTAPDTVYRLHVAEGGVVVRVRFDDSATDFDAVFALSKLCARDASELGAREVMCGNDEFVTLGPNDFGDYWLYIDGVDGASGHFDFVVDILPQVPNGAACILGEPVTAPPIEIAQHRCASNFCYDSLSGPICADQDSVPPHDCGNSVVEWPELCDDGNRLNDDACRADCTNPTDTCATVTLPAIDPTEHVFGSTMGQTSAVHGTCGGINAGEDAFELSVPSVSRVIVSAQFPGTDFATVLDMRRVCTPAHESDEVQCAAHDGLNSAFIREPELSPGQYIVYVDGLYGASGNYELGAWLTPLVGAGDACRPDFDMPDLQDNCAPASRTRCRESGVGTYTCQ